MMTNSNKPKIKAKNANEAVIPVKGSLGLLAYGYKGVLAWREVRHKDFLQKQINESKSEKK